MIQVESELFLKCRTLYEAMDRDGQDTPEGRFWTGALTALLAATAESANSINYAQVVGALIDMECITQIRKGGGRAPSVWRLDRPPTLELVHLIQPKRSNNRASKQEQTNRELMVLANRITTLEHDLRAVVEFLNLHYQANLSDLGQSDE